MYNPNETQSDIFAEMRNAVRPIKYGEDEVRGILCSGEVEAYIERLEAAAARGEDEAADHATMRAEAVARDNCRDCVHNPAGRNYDGVNTAKLREALEEMTAFWDAHGKAYSVQVAPVRESEDAVEAELERVMGNARAALAAPPRNCDRFATEEDAMVAFRTEHCQSCNGVEGAPRKICLRCLGEWLFAPAVQEGGDHADA